MTAQPTAPPRSRTRTTLRRSAAVLLTLAIGLGGGLTYCSADWKSSVFSFDLPGGDYRVRLTGSSGSECARLERETNFDEFSRWQTTGKDCAWPKVSGGDGWLAGGQVVQVVEDKGDSTKDWILFGIVPAAATEVVLTLADGKARRAPTRAAGGGANRIYALLAPGVGDRAELVAIVLHDGRGGEVRVY